LERLAEQMTPEIYDGLWDAVDSLAELPERCALVPESKLRAKRVRHLLYGPGRQVYRILYRVRDERVEILTIRHARRRPLSPCRVPNPPAKAMPERSFACSESLVVNSQGAEF